MVQISAKLVRVSDPEGYPAGGLGHWCPACGIMHVFAVGEPSTRGVRWTWDGDVDRPTFQPDMNIAWGDELRAAFAGRGGGRCHYRLAAGVLEFAWDCTHALRGRRVPLPRLPAHLVDIRPRAETTT